MQLSKLRQFAVLFVTFNFICLTAMASTDANCWKRLVETTEIQSELASLISKHRFVIPAAEVEKLAIKHQASIDDLMLGLIVSAKPFARPGVSNFQVGAVGRTTGGDLVIGVNLEFARHALNQTVHAEQFVVALAHVRGLPPLESIASSSPPCGHCRQWLYETDGAENLRVLTPAHPVMQLTDLLPMPFGPKDLGVTAALLARQPKSDGLPIDPDAEVALAIKSYAPYSKTLAGVILRTNTGETFTGSAIENAAFNPSLSPIHTALIDAVASGVNFNDIVHATLVEGKIDQIRDTQVSYRSVVTEVMKSIAPNAQVEFRTFEFFPDSWL